MSWHCIKAALRGLAFGVGFLAALVALAAAIGWGLSTLATLLGPQIGSLLFLVIIGMTLAYVIGSFVVLSLEDAGCLTKKEITNED